MSDNEERPVVHGYENDGSSWVAVDGERSSTPSLPEFLLARIAEDEAVGRAAVRWSEGATQWADAGEPDWQHIARWSPTRVLAECEAKRRIVTRYVRARALVGKHPHAATADAALLGALMDMALPYAGHPDYRQEWKP